MPEDMIDRKAVKRWAIVSWKHDDLVDGRYGKLLAMVEGDYEEAHAHAIAYIPECSPVSICGIVEP